MPSQRMISDASGDVLFQPANEAALSLFRTSIPRRQLKKKYTSIDYLIGHSEYREFEGHPLWLELDDSYRTDKVDPGDRFMTAVRKAVVHLDLKGPEEIRAERLLE